MQVATVERALIEESKGRRVGITPRCKHICTWTVGGILRELVESTRRFDGREVIAFVRDIPIFGLRMQMRGDHSGLVARLRGELRSWEALPREAQISLIEGERRLEERTAADHSSEVVSFAKAVEVSLHRLVFDAFADSVRKESGSEDDLRQAREDERGQAMRLVGLIERGSPLELGSMTHALRLARGRTAGRLLLLGRFRTFVEEQRRCPALLAPESLSDLEKLSSYRNPAAHARAFGIEAAREVRELALRQLNRLVPSGDDHARSRARAGDRSDPGR